MNCTGAGDRSGMKKHWGDGDQKSSRIDSMRNWGPLERSWRRSDLDMLSSPKTYQRGLKTSRLPFLTRHNSGWGHSDGANMERGILVLWGLKEASCPLPNFYLRPWVRQLSWCSLWVSSRRAGSGQCGATVRFWLQCTGWDTPAAGAYSETTLQNFLWILAMMKSLEQGPSLFCDADAECTLSPRYLGSPLSKSLSLPHRPNHQKWNVALLLNPSHWNAPNMSVWIPLTTMLLSFSCTPSKPAQDASTPSPQPLKGNNILPDASRLLTKMLQSRTQSW